MLQNKKQASLVGCVTGREKVNLFCVIAKPTGSTLLIP
jgi:hypothetical protein